MATKLRSPFEIETPPGAEGWADCYPYYRLFREERREADSERFWFHDGMHHPEPLYPFDDITAESWWLGLGQYNTRIFVVPPALGIEQRVLNGYLYVSPVPVQDPAEIAQRLTEFRTRAGYYYQNWDRLYGLWKEKVVAEIHALDAVVIEDLPDIEPLSVVETARGLSSAYDLLNAYATVTMSMCRVWQYHFEFLNLGYAAYLTYYTFCKETFPGITDQTVARMVAGIDIDVFRPDDELKRLARRAVELGVHGALLEHPRPDECLERLSQSDNGRSWISDYGATRDKWFNYSSSTGFYHLPYSWKEDPSVPFDAMRGYVQRVLKGETIERPIAALTVERERIFQEYLELIVDPDRKKAFSDLVGLARMVFPYVEEHNFYVEHWHHSVFWRKVRQLGDVLKTRGVLLESDDIFYLNRFELSQVLYDVCASWGVGVDPVAAAVWRPRIAERRKIFAALKEWTPPPYLGKLPQEIREPFTIMLWGVTSQHLITWLSQAVDGEGKHNELRGHPASRGVVEGRARVITKYDELSTVRDGEILVCPITTPSWAPIFGKLRATVTNIGGIMSHAAIVCREYGLPAVVGTGNATTRIRTGQLLRVDGGTGIVTILEE